MFSIVGAVLAVAVAYQSHQEMSVYLIDLYPLELWRAQAIAFVAIIVGISLAAPCWATSGQRRSVLPFCDP